LRLGGRFNAAKPLLYAGCGYLPKNSKRSTKQKELKKRKGWK